MKSRVIIVGILFALLLCGFALADCGNSQCQSGKNCPSDCGKNQITGQGCGCVFANSTVTTSVSSDASNKLSTYGCNCKGTVSTGKQCTCGSKTTTSTSCGCKR